LVTVLVLVGFVYIIVALILFLRQSDRRIGLLGAFTLVLFGAVSLTETPSAVASVYPQLLLPIYILDYIGVILLPLFVIIFPDGRLKPRWTIGLIIAWAILRIPSYFLQRSVLDSNTWPFVVQAPLWFGFIASLILVQQYRYRKVYGPVLRQQTKWVVYGMSVSLAGFIITQSVFAFMPVPVVLAGVSIIFANILMYLLMLMIPLSIAIAVLRYKLWDIDLIINRTLVYVPLTAIVGGLFSASTTLTQKIFIAITGQASDAVLVITTFVIVTTFTPIKNALQAAVDKRFKEPNNPVKEINAFDDQVRSVVEVLDARTITDRLLNQIAETTSAGD
jgi:hypothetical protein